VAFAHTHSQNHLEGSQRMTPNDVLGQLSIKLSPKQHLGYVLKWNAKHHQDASMGNFSRWHQMSPQNNNMLLPQEQTYVCRHETSLTCPKFESWNPSAWSTRQTRELDHKLGSPTWFNCPCHHDAHHDGPHLKPTMHEFKPCHSLPPHNIGQCPCWCFQNFAPTLHAPITSRFGITYFSTLVLFVFFFLDSSWKES
jgi:hypothetical protein